MKDVAIHAVQTAGELLRNHFGQNHAIQYKNDRGSIVTALDFSSEQTILNIISSSFPEHDIITEETRNDVTTSSEYVWIVDPLDGTANYVSGNAYFNVSIALQYLGETLLGVTYNPITDDLFVAEKGAGLLYNNVQIEIQGAAQFKDARICVDWSHCNIDKLEKMTRILTTLASKVRGVLSYGCGALAAAQVAAGIFDAYFNIQSNPWDHAAACLIIQEAGGKATTVDGKAQHGLTYSVLVANETLHGCLLECLNEVPE